MLASASVRAEDPAPDEAQQLLEQALQRYRDRDYAAALDLLDRVYSLAPNPGVLYNLGAVHAALGHCEEARAAYRRYIAQTHSDTGRADAQRQLDSIGLCEAPPADAQATAASAPLDPSRSLPEASSPEPTATGSSPPTAAVTVTPSPVAPAPDALPPEALPPAPAESSLGASPDQRGEAESGSGVQRVAGWVAIGSGGAMLVTSLSFAYASQRAQNSDRTTEPGASGDAVADRQATGSRYNALAWGFGGGALALGSAGLLLLLLDPEPAPKTSIAVSPQGKTGAWGVTVAHRF